MSSNSSILLNSSSLKTHHSLQTEHVEYDSFDSFGALPYLQEYYSSIDHENEELLRFYAQTYSSLPSGGTLLEFSGGPTVYSLITAASKVDSIHFSDFLAINRQEVRRWVRKSKNAFNWHHFITRALELENTDGVTDEMVAQRAAEIRSKITRVVRCNAFQPFSLRYNAGNLYDIVNVNFVPESITADRDLWELALKNICSLVKPGGYIFITSLKNSHYYIFDGKKFPALRIAEADMCDVLQRNNFDIENAFIHSIDAKPFRGYEGMIFIRAQKHHA